jgi:pyruvate dehydrogenase E1 component beta subunit
MLSAIEHPGPVVFLEHKLLSQSWLEVVGGSARAILGLDVPLAGAVGEVGDPPEPVPIGESALRRGGHDVAIISLGVGVHRALEAAGRLADNGVEAAVLDLRSVAPLDTAAVLSLAATTGRVLVVDEDYRRGGLSGEIAAVVAESGVAARFARVTCEDTIPFARALESRTLPDVPRIVTAARRLMGSSVEVS